MIAHSARVENWVEAPVREARYGASDARAAQGERPESAARSLATIREMARDFGVSIRTLRFYEDRGLLRPAREGAARLYDENQRRALKMILRAKQLGFTLAEISEMMRTRGGSLDAVPEQGDGVEDNELELALPPDQIAAQIFHLERQRKELDAAIVTLRSVHRRLLESPCRAAIV